MGDNRDKKRFAQCKQGVGVKRLNSEVETLAT